MKRKHAYLIMAHHKFDILKKVLSDIDDERNDIFLHIDSKSKNINLKELTQAVNKSDLYLLDRMNIHWGGYSQIKCILELLKQSTKIGYHDYYHFMVGVEFPLKNQEVIHTFFERNFGKEFIGFCYDGDFLSRVKFLHPFNEYARNNNILQKFLNKIRIGAVQVQRILGVDISKKYEIEFKKGNANWSITDDLARFVISKENEIRKIYKHSWCGDELFIHTIVYNSKYWDSVYDQKDEYHSSMRTMTWSNKANRYHLNDINYLLTCDRLFARKIDGEDAIQLINAIISKRSNTIPN